MIRFGLLGCGRIAKRHSELLGGGHIDGASLVAVCDPVRARADVIASKFGVPRLLRYRRLSGAPGYRRGRGPDAEWNASPACHRLREGGKTCGRGKADGAAGFRMPTT